MGCIAILQVKDRQQLLIEMLMEGHPQSFVDFFYLTEGEDEKLDQVRRVLISG
jgi:hypothetical protein